MKASKLHFFGLLAVAMSLSACQSTSTSPVDLGLGNTTPQTAAPQTTIDPATGQPMTQTAVAEPGRITDVELRAYCPKVTLRDGTSFFRTYEGKDTEDPQAVIYQAALGETSRDCSYANGMLTMVVAVAGRVVPGPKGRDGNITMPIRVAVTRGEEVLYSQLHQQPVQVASAGATQFVFKDSAVTFPAPTSRNITVFVGYDEGPYDTP